MCTLRYVSFAEIFLVKSVDGFTDEGYTDDEAMRYSTLCFFAGILLTAALNGLVHFICRKNQILNKSDSGKSEIEMTAEETNGVTENINKSVTDAAVH